LFQKIRITNSRFDSQLDKKIDVFAYGMTLYWLAAGKKPWAEISNADEIERLVVADERPKFDPEGEADDCVKKLLQRVSVKCCLQDPNDRPSFDEILNSLTGHQKGEQSTL
jgi:serine/threonine protein kinase